MKTTLRIICTTGDQLRKAIARAAIQKGKQTVIHLVPETYVISKTLPINGATTITWDAD